MTVLHPRDAWTEFDLPTERPVRTVRGPRRIPAADAVGRSRPATVRGSSRRPTVAPLQHRRSGVLMSRASHRRRPITPATTVLLAMIAAAFTVWLGLVAQSGGVLGPQEQISGRLAVVQVHSGESLQHVAQRVAPDAPVGQVVERIRELNKLETSSLDAGQTLIAPVA